MEEFAFAGGARSRARKLAKLFFALNLSIGAFWALDVCRALTLSPPTYEIGATPGQTLTTGLKIFNETDTGGTFYFETQNFTAKGDNGEPEFIEEDAKTDLASWIETPASIDLAAGELKRVEFQIRVPENADPGGHYAAIFLSNTPPSNGNGSVGISSKIGTLVLLRVEGDVVEQAKLASFGLAENKKIAGSLPVKFITRIENNGTVFVKPSGTIKIFNIFGIKTAETTVNIGKMPDGSLRPVGNVLSNSARKFESVWGTAQNAGGGNFFEKLIAEKNNFALGMFTAQLDLTYGIGNDKKITDKITFWVLPWRIMLVGSLVLMIALIIFIQGIKNYNRWIINKAQNQPPKRKK